MHEIFNLKFFHKLEVSSLLINTLKYIHHLLQYNWVNQTSTKFILSYMYCATLKINLAPVGGVS